MNTQSQIKSLNHPKSGFLRVCKRSSDQLSKHKERIKIETCWNLFLKTKGSKERKRKKTDKRLRQGREERSSVSFRRGMAGKCCREEGRQGKEQRVRKKGGLLRNIETKCWSFAPYLPLHYPDIHALLSLCFSLFPSQCSVSLSVLVLENGTDQGKRESVSFWLTSLGGKKAQLNSLLCLLFYFLFSILNFYLCRFHNQPTHHHGGTTR